MKVTLSFNVCNFFVLCNNYFLDAHDDEAKIRKFITSEDISIYVDVWCSLNGRFQQRMFDPTYDLLKANWSPFTAVEWLLPLLTEYSDFREKMFAIEKEVYEWSNATNVLFVADFPGNFKSLLLRKNTFSYVT